MSSSLVRDHDRICIKPETEAHFYALARSHVRMARECMREKITMWTRSRSEERTVNRDGWLADAARCREIARRMRAARTPTAETPRFSALRWYRIRGRGFCAVVECDRERDRAFSGLLGLVVIDDEPFECVRVELHALGFPVQSGEPIALWVKET
jgi:hypothetical protein